MASLQLPGVLLCRFVIHPSLLYIAFLWDPLSCDPPYMHVTGGLPKMESDALFPLLQKFYDFSGISRSLRNVY